MFRPDGFPHFPPASRNPPPYARFFTNDCLNPSGGLRHGLPSTHTTQSQAAVARATAGKVLASRCARHAQRLQGRGGSERSIVGRGTATSRTYQLDF